MHIETNPLALHPPSTGSLMPIAVRPDLMFLRGEGSHLFDYAGRRYLDWVQGWAVNCLGHSPTILIDALARQAATLINASPAFFNAPAAELATLLTTHSCFDHVFFGSSGAEANEGAIKLARKYGRLRKQGAHEIITFTHGFHGRTLATMSASGKPGWDRLFAPMPAGFPKAVLNDLASVRALISVNTVAVMLEPIQGEAGVIPADPAFVRDLRNLCDEHGLLLIFDEVQTGCGRTGSLFAYEQFGIEPDIMTLGKGIGGGIPLSALLAKRACSCFEPGDQGGTYCGNPLACAAGLAVMQALAEPGFLASSRQVAQQLKTELHALAQTLNLGEVRGRGMLLALELGADLGQAVVTQAREDGLLLNSPRPHCLRFMPALNSREDEIAEGMRILRAAIEKVLAEPRLGT